MVKDMKLVIHVYNTSDVEPVKRLVSSLGGKIIGYTYNPPLVLADVPETALQRISIDPHVRMIEKSYGGFRALQL